MLIEITKPTAIRGEFVFPGDRLDVDNDAARVLCQFLKAKPAGAEQAPEPEAVTEPEPEAVKPKRGRKRKLT